MNPKKRYPHTQAYEVARELQIWLANAVTRITVAGSLRRQKLDVGDIEIVYVPRVRKDTTQDLFQPVFVNQADETLGDMLNAGIIAKRENKVGVETWGEHNKLAVHVASGIPVDFFSTSDACWWNYLVCRTGGAENNKRICIAAQSKGWKWKPYGAGFEDEQGALVRVNCEEDVYRLVGLPYRQPFERL